MILLPFLWLVRVIVYVLAELLSNPKQFIRLNGNLIVIPSLQGVFPLLIV